MVIIFKYLTAVNGMNNMQLLNTILCITYNLQPSAFCKKIFAHTKN